MLKANFQIIPFIHSNFGVCYLCLTWQGEHNSTYMVSSSKNGLQFTKIRHSHPVERATGSYSKVRCFLLCNIAAVCLYHFEKKHNIVLKVWNIMIIYRLIFISSDFKSIGKTNETQNLVFLRMYLTILN